MRRVMGEAEAAGQAGEGSPIEGMIPAGRFPDWLASFRAAHRKGEGVEVACGDCQGCCTSSYFIHIGPEEKETLAKVPKALVFPAPGRPKGHVLLGYDEKGHCPMFREGRCSIYAHRPRTCRQYDCRVFAATGIHPGEDKPAIGNRSGRWVFTRDAREGEEALAAVREAARFLRTHGAEFPAGFVPAQPLQQALMALKVHRVFLRREGGAAEQGGLAAIVSAVVMAWQEEDG